MRQNIEQKTPPTSTPIKSKPTKSKTAVSKTIVPKTLVPKTADTPPSRRMPNKSVEPFYAKLAQTIGKPQTELKYHTNFELLLAVILSAQATDISVNLATRKLYPVANTPQAILDLGEEGLKDYIRTIGLYNAKAKNIIKTCQDLLEKFDGEVPETREGLESLAGVGRKTANVMLNTAFGQPTMAVDTHIFRVGNRTGLATGKNVLEVEQALLARMPEQYAMDAHHYLILHGRYTCKARTPECGKCPVFEECMFKDKGRFVDR